MFFVIIFPKIREACAPLKAILVAFEVIVSHIFTEAELVRRAGIRTSQHGTKHSPLGREGSY